MPKILVVADASYILMSLEFLRKKAGYEMMVARNGSEALELVESRRPDLVLLDITMPDVDGYAICSHIKSTPELAQILVISVSVKTRDADIRKGLAPGAARYISKPFSTRDLMAEVKQALESA